MILTCAGAGGDSPFPSDSTVVPGLWPCVSAECHPWVEMRPALGCPARDIIYVPAPPEPGVTPTAQLAALSSPRAGPGPGSPHSTGSLSSQTVPASCYIPGGQVPQPQIFCSHVQPCRKCFWDMPTLLELCSFTLISTGTQCL